MSKSKQLVIITHNFEDGIRQVLFGLQYALAMLNMGIDVLIFITGSTVKWTYKEASKKLVVGEINSLNSYLRLCVNHGGEILVCSTCYETQVCAIANLDNKENSLIPGARLCGLTEVAEKSFERDVSVY